MSIWLALVLIVGAFVVGAIFGSSACPEEPLEVRNAPPPTNGPGVSLSPGERFALAVTRTEVSLAVFEYKIRHSGIRRSSVGRCRLELRHNPMEGLEKPHVLMLEGKKLH